MTWAIRRRACLALRRSCPGSGILAGSILGANTHTLLTRKFPRTRTRFSATSSAGGGAHAHLSATTPSDGCHTHSRHDRPVGVDHTHTVAPGTPSTQNRHVYRPGQRLGRNGRDRTTSSVLGFRAYSHGIHDRMAARLITRTRERNDRSEAPTYPHVSGHDRNGSGSGTAHNNLSRCHSRHLVHEALRP
jgi:hypothetical protein